MSLVPVHVAPLVFHVAPLVCECLESLFRAKQLRLSRPTDLQLSLKLTRALYRRLPKAPGLARYVERNMAWNVAEGHVHVYGGGTAAAAGTGGMIDRPQLSLGQR